MKFKLTQIGASQTPNYTKEVGISGTVGLIHVQGDCNYRLSIWANSDILDYFYDIKNANQQSGGICYNNEFNPQFTSSKSPTLQRIYIGYKLQPPDPLKMENGTYKGSLTLSLGRNKDLDFGDAAYSDSNVTIEFTLRVTHQLKVEFPAGSNKVILQPPKGWAPWINSGKTPPNLKAELPFRLWKSAEAYVSLNYCQYEKNGKCQLKNTKNNHKVDINISYVSGLGNLAPLTKSKYTIFNDGIFIDIKRKIAFEIDKANLTEMMKYPGSTYQGDVTIMFEAEIPPL